jgi:DNA-binding response OmpR family regulator
MLSICRRSELCPCEGELANYRCSLHTSYLPDPRLRGLRILIVEDAPAVADALQYLLEDIGMVVVGPASTPHAAEQLLSEQPQLAVVDMQLGDHTGDALIKRLRAIKVPVLAMSGSVELLARSGKVATLQKPFSGQELLEAVLQLVP